MICTSQVERSNLTMRTFLRRMTRLCWGFSKKLENLRAAIALYFAHYNFCRIHGTLRVTPAMEAGLTDHVWTLSELLTSWTNYVPQTGDNSEITCRFLVIERMWEVARAEDVLIKHYDPEWNGIPGFSMHVPGSGRPGKAGYVNEWDRRFPPTR